VDVDRSKGRVLRSPVIEGAGCGTGVAEEGRGLAETCGQPG